MFSMYQYFISFLWLNSIPLYRYTTFVYIHQLIDIWVVSTLRLLWIMLLLTFIYKFLCGCVFSNLLCINLGVELLGHIVTQYLAFWGTSRVFSKVASAFYISTSNAWQFHFLHILTNTCYYLSVLFQPS